MNTPITYDTQQQYAPMYYPAPKKDNTVLKVVLAIFIIPSIISFVIFIIMTAIALYGANKASKNFARDWDMSPITTGPISTSPSITFPTKITPVVSSTSIKPV
jgi:hypothetical protein